MRIRVKYLVLSLLLLVISPFSAMAADQFVSVTFKPTVDHKFIDVLNAMFGTTVYERVDPYTYRFKLPKSKPLNAYVELFSSLPYVVQTSPKPQYQVGDHIVPKAYNVQGVPTGKPTNKKGADFVPQQILVKFKPNATQEDIKFLNSHHQTSVLSILPGIGVYQLQLAQGQSVQEAVKTYSQSGIVDYAEPNYKVGILDAQSGNNTTGVLTAVPLDAGGQMIVDFKAGVSPIVPQLFNIIFETELVEKRSFYSYRLQLPPQLNLQLAQRVFKLCPYVINVQPAY